MSKPTLTLSHINRSYGKGSMKIEVLKDINLSIQAGEIVALVGPSGSGKSTLLHIAGLLDAPTKGSIEIEGVAVHLKTDKQRTALRRDKIGFVYQAHLLLPDFSALENVMMPQLLRGVKPQEAKTNAQKLLTQMGLGTRLKHRSGQLSGGEQQRVAIARALANQPVLLLADEPTGNLDPKTAEAVFQLLLRVVRETGLSAFIATHNPELASRMDRRVSVVDGILHELP